MIIRDDRGTVAALLALVVVAALILVLVISWLASGDNAPTRALSEQTAGVSPAAPEPSAATTSTTIASGSCVAAGQFIIEGDAALVRGEDGLRVSVTSPDGFPVGALFWILRIGDTEFHLSQRPDGAIDRIEFPIPPDAYSRLRDGDGIGIRYGTPTRGGASGWAEIALTFDRGEGFAHVRFSDGCP